VLGIIIILEFIIGDHPLGYNTSAADQNKLIDGRPHTVVTLDANVKNDLRKCHFTLGNFDPNYQTATRSEFYDKSGQNKFDTNQYKDIGKSLRSHNYILGNDVPNYKSETGTRYITPVYKDGER